MYQGTTMVATEQKDRSVGLSSNFRDRADSAAFFEAWVGAVLARAGLYTLHHPFTLAETREDIGSYAQTVDLDVDTEPPQNPNTSTFGWGTEVEVKSSNLTFHNTQSYPFPELLICSQSSWEKKWLKASKTCRNFLFVSRQTGAILWLPTKTPVTLGNLVHDATRNQTYKAVKTSSDNLRALDEFVHMVKRG